MIKQTIGRIAFQMQTIDGTPEPPVKVIKGGVNHVQMDEDVRRLCLSLLTVIKRKYPKDWRKMMSEVV